MKKRIIQQAFSISNLFIIAFTPAIVWLFLYYIPFGTAIDRTVMLTLFNSIEVKVILWFTCISLFWIGINYAFSLLKQLDITFRRANGMGVFLTLMWGLYAAYFLFFSR